MFFSDEINKMIENGMKFNTENVNNEKEFVENAIRFYYNMHFNENAVVNNNGNIEQSLTEIHKSIIENGESKESREKTSDFVDWITHLWSMQSLPVPKTLPIFFRLVRIGQHLDLLESMLRAEPNQLSLNELRLLFTVVRSGKDGRITPTKLKESLLISAGAISKQIERLRVKGLLERITDPKDRRSVWVELTAEGHELINKIAFDENRNPTVVLKDLSEKEQLVLNHILKNLLIKLENEVKEKV